MINCPEEFELNLSAFEPQNPAGFESQLLL